MDRYKSDCVSPLLTGNGCFIPKFRSGIPDVAWGICLDQHQAESFTARNKQGCFSIFDQVRPLSDGHLYLRLTPDVSVVPKSKAKELWELLWPQLCIAEYTINCVRDVPISFRLGIDSSNLQINECGYYRITRQMHDDWLLFQFLLLGRTHKVFRQVHAVWKKCHFIECPTHNAKLV